MTLDLVSRVTIPLALIGMIFILGVLLLAVIVQFYSGNIVFGFLMLSVFCFFSLLIRGLWI